MKSHLVYFFADNNEKFYERGIMKLSKRWQKVIEQNGKYIIDQSLFLVFKRICLVCTKISEITPGATQYLDYISKMGFP